jgi:hypothetical protein
MNLSQIGSLIPGMSQLNSLASSVASTAGAAASSLGGAHPQITPGGNGFGSTAKASGADAGGGMLDQLRQSLSQIPGIGPFLDSIMKAIESTLGGGASEAGGAGQGGGASRGGGAGQAGSAGQAGAAGGAQGGGNPLEKIMQQLQAIPGMSQEMLGQVMNALKGLIG